MNKQTKREVVAALVKAGRRDLAEQFIGAAPLIEVQTLIGRLQFSQEGARQIAVRLQPMRLGPRFFNYRGTDDPTKKSEKAKDLLEKAFKKFSDDVVRKMKTLGYE